MKRNTLVSIPFFCAAMLWQTGCQQQAKPEQEPAAAVKTPKSGPKIEFESLEYDFGKVGPGQKFNGQFKFTNTGDEQLKIRNIEKCCGAVLKVDREELAPGESGVVDVTYTSSRHAGKMMKHLYINSNDKATPRAMLTIKAETVLRVNYEPRSLTLLKDENAGCPKITLTSTDGAPFSIAGFTSTGNGLTADFDSSVEATQFVLEPKADMEKLQKSRFGRVNISMAFSQPEPASETATITYRVLSRFSLSPSMLMVLYDKPDKPIQKTLRLTNNYGEDFEVESTASKEGYIKVLSQKKIGNRCQFSLEITPPPGEDVKRFTDTLTINLRGSETLEVACRGIYRTPVAAKVDR